MDKRYLDVIVLTNLADKAILPLLCMRFTRFFAHGFLPESMLSVVLLPMIKYKAGKIYSKKKLLSSCIS